MANRPTVLLVAGTRPEIIKMAPVIRALSMSNDVETLFVLSGQHYDYNMAWKFVEELGLPSPIANIKAGSGSHAEQTARLLIGYEKLLKKSKPTMTVAEGDTNTVLALGLSSIKLKIPFAHVEAGLRNYDRSMPEEINRVVAGATAELHFAPTPLAALNLLYEGVPPHKIYVTGNTIVDACLQHAKLAEQRSRILEELKLSPPFVLTTVHRAENVDDPKRLGGILKALNQLQGYRIVFPAHPRTRKRLKEFKLDGLVKAGNILLIKPLGYLDFLRLLSKASLVVTDSGGVQEEALTLGVPCITLRQTTERPETVEAGANVVVGARPESIVFYARKILGGGEGLKVDTRQNPLGDGKAGERIAKIIVEKCYSGISIEEPEPYEGGYMTFKLVEVKGPMDGLAVSDFNARYRGAFVSLVYDEAGVPMFPYPELVLKGGWRLRLFGPKAALDRARG